MATTDLPNKPQAHSKPPHGYDDHQHQHHHRRPSQDMPTPPSSFTNSLNSNTVLTEITEDEKDNESIMFTVAEPAFSPPPAMAPPSSWRQHFRRQSLTANCPNDCQQPLTVFAKLTIQPGNERDFEQWYKDITKIQNDHWPGYMSSELLKPMAHSNDYISIFRYDNYAHLEAWMMSTQRHEMLQRAKAFSKEPPLLSFHSLEYWFVPPTTTNSSGGDDNTETMNNNNDEENADPTEASSGEQQPAAAQQQQQPAGPPRPPAKYKMVIVTALVIWAMNQWTGKVLVLIFGVGTLPKPLLQFLTTLLTVIAAAYVALPVSTALLGFWLFPAQPYLTTVRNGFISLPWPVPKLITSMESYYYTTFITKRDAAADAKRKEEEEQENNNNNSSDDEDEAVTEHGGNSSRSKVPKTEVEHGGGGDNDDDEPKRGISENQINAESNGDMV
jgi:antibiotic biosynthesis monooxygenase (ABM) superfamily enzyme